MGKVSQKEVNVSSEEAEKILNSKVDFDEEAYWDNLEKKHQGKTSLEDPDEESDKNPEVTEDEKDDEDDEDDEDEKDEKDDEDDEDDHEKEEDDEDRESDEESEDKPQDADKLENKGDDDEDSEEEDVVVFDGKKIDEYVTALSVKDNISEEAAKEIIEKDHELAKNYQYDPLKLARTVRNSQAEYDKLRNKTKQTEATAQPNDIQVLDDGIKAKSAFYRKDDIIEHYRKSKPSLTEDLDDDKVWEIAKEHTQAFIKEDENKRMASAKIQAQDVIEEYVSKIPEADKKFTSKARELLQTIDPLTVISPDFDDSFNWYLAAIRGQSYHDDIKAGREEAFNRGKEAGSKKIVRERIPSGTSKGHAPTKKSKSVTLSPSEKKEAITAYPEISEREAYELYAETKKIWGLE